MIKISAAYQVGVACALLWNPLAHATDPSVIEAAKKEGRVVFYSSLGSHTLDSLTMAFNKKYPGIKAEYYRSTSTGLMTRLDAEIAAKRLQADVINISNPAEMEDLKERSLLVAYKSPEYVSYAKTFVDPDFTWFVAKTHLIVLAYNTAQLKRAPASWLDLNDPSLKGRVGITDPRSVGAMSYWRHAMVMLYGADYVSKLAANKPFIATGVGNLNDRVVSGELHATVDFSYLVDASVTEHKAPIKAVYPAEGVPAVSSVVGILKGAPNPNAAKLFVDFAASREGQIEFNKGFTYSMRSDVPISPGMKPLTEIKVLNYSPQELRKEQDRVAEISRKPFGLK